METLQNVALIIEDEVDICMLLTEFLKLKNYYPINAGTLKAIMEINEEIYPKIIFVDNRLPDGFGFDMIPTLRKNYPDSKIIAMTAQDICTNKQMAIDNGADYFMEKPFTLDEILRHIS